ncbi:MAG TPA: hypothetical protein VJK90_12850 [Acetobacteraceae bacterium]|nr:hypothetical protein [Acetobacteraceae bacterium]
MSGSPKSAWVKRVLGLDAGASRPDGPRIGSARGAAPARGYDTAPETGAMPRFASAYSTPDASAGNYV